MSCPECDFGAPTHKVRFEVAYQVTFFGKDKVLFSTREAAEKSLLDFRAWAKEVDLRSFIVPHMEIVTRTIREEV